MTVQPLAPADKLALKRSLCRAIVGLQDAILSNEHDTAGSLAQVNPCSTSCTTRAPPRMAPARQDG